MAILVQEVDECRMARQILTAGLASDELEQDDVGNISTSKRQSSIVNVIGNMDEL